MRCRVSERVGLFHDKRYRRLENVGWVVGSRVGGNVLGQQKPWIVL